MQPAPPARKRSRTPRTAILLGTVVVALVASIVFVTVRETGRAPRRDEEPELGAGHTEQELLKKDTLNDEQCLARRSDDVTAFPQGTEQRRTYDVSSVPDGHTYDLRNVVALTDKYAFTIGADGGGRETCVVGGTAIGQQSRALNWRQMKDDHDGDGLRLEGRTWMSSYGLRVDNWEDGFSPRPPELDEGFTRTEFFKLSNAYMTYIRDDCVENDVAMSGLVSDSLLDGCWIGFSARPGRGGGERANPRGLLRIEDVLVRLEPMPAIPEADEPENRVGHAQLFKWSDEAGRVAVRDSIFLVAQHSVNGPKSMRFPPGSYRNVTLVWLGPGDYPQPLPSGVTVTRDPSAWDEARDRWLRRHGCPAGGDRGGRACTKLSRPDPLARSGS